MIKKCFRPFWSFDVQETEKWLADMAGQGWRLSHINFNTRAFLFEQCEPHRVVYRIQYLRVFDGSLSQGLAMAGWSIVSSSRHWCFYQNTEKSENIQNIPLRDGIFKRNTILFGAALLYTILWCVVAFGLLPLVPLIALSGAILSLFDNGISLVISHYPWIASRELWVSFFIVVIFSGIVFFVSIFMLVELSSSNRRLKMGMNYFNIARAVKSVQNPSVKNHQQIRKTRLFWNYAPDKTEAWLESMAANGYCLERLSGNVFYFIKTTPSNIKYCMDYHGVALKEYYDLHSCAGWTLVYAAQSPLQSKWTIWAKQYQKGDEAPEIYTDKYELLCNIKSFAGKTTGMLLAGFLFFVLLFGWQIASIIHRMNDLFQQNAGYIDAQVIDISATILWLMIGVAIIVCSLLPTMYILLAIQPLRYYFRMKKKYGNGK